MSKVSIFPPAHLQSPQNGCTGSNACTLIALPLCKLHLAAPELPRPYHPLTFTWAFEMVQGMEIGKKFYDSYSAGNLVMFGMREAVQNVRDLWVLNKVNYLVLSNPTSIGSHLKHFLYILPCAATNGERLLPSMLP